MSFEHPGDGNLAYSPCRYGNSRLLFRGPRHSLDQPYCAVVGGTETYGKFIPRPFSTLVEEKLGLPVVNLGCVNAGIDVFMNDPAVLEVVAGARVTVIQALGAHNMSNRFYVVHPRRNDRFLRSSAMLKALYPSIDFTEFHFTRHMLSALRDRSETAFEIVIAELQMAWQARMRSLAASMPGDKVLLWMSLGRRDGNGLDDGLDDGPGDGMGDGLGSDPVFVTRHMIETVSPYFTRVVEVQASDAAIATGTEGMVHSELDAPAAMALPGPAVHDEVAEALTPVLRELMP